MKNKLVIIFVIILICFGFLASKSIKSGFNGVTQVTNPISEYNSIADLQKSVRFTFQVPEFIANSHIKAMNSYMGQMIEIETDSAIFRAAPFIDYDADISGDYSSFDIDNKYSNDNGDIYVRYRVNSNKTIVSIISNEIAYSISVNTMITEEQAFELMGINKEGLKNFEAKQIEKNESTEGISEANNTEISSMGSDELTFKQFKNTDMNISFMTPVINSELFGVYSENNLAIMIGDQIAYIICNKSSNQEFNGYTYVNLSDDYRLVYVLDNKFEKGSQLYYDYYTVIENIDVVVDTFKVGG